MPSKRLPLLKMTLGSALAGLTAGGGALMASNSETILRQSFAAAIAPRHQPSPIAPSAAATPLAASEEFWLAAIRPDANVAPVSKSVSLGDSMTITLNGQNRVLRVTSVTEFSPEKTEVDLRSPNIHLVVVTAHDTTDTAAKPVRFVMEIEGKASATTGLPPGKTL